MEVKIDSISSLTKLLSVHLEKSGEKNRLINLDNFLRNPTFKVPFIKIKITVDFEIFKLSCVSINFLSFAQYSIACRDNANHIFLGHYQMKYVIKLTIQFQDHVFIFFTGDFFKVVKLLTRPENLSDYKPKIC
ncbi:hypothetical protein BpHYR1_017907 [Brachionus plicatilis]|uniref:Uncharacterized protein n=1 Tax=Brachionus plicatilis TaxID=10195 RepID=A0A3M7SXI1_BRAPC|nr:hypothetical protein BpHYR1_017907 [Brachionus plicatilis]